MSDPRSSIKTLLDDNIINANLTRDNGSTQLNWHVMFEGYSVPLPRIFLDKELDLVFPISDSEPAETVLGVSHKGRYTVTPSAIDKTGITATLVLWKATKELRRVFKDNPWGSLRSLTEETIEVHNYGDTKIWSKPCRVEYKTYST